MKNTSRVVVFSIVKCFLVMAVVGCARPEPAVEIPPPSAKPSVEAKAPAVSPVAAAPEAAGLELVLSEAAEYAEKGQLDEAATIYERALRERPGNFKLHYNLGNVYLESGSTDKAIAEYKKALEINPEDRDSYINLGAAYYERDMVEDATVTYKRALALDPHDPEAHYNLGVAYESLGRQTEADTEFAIYQELTGESL